MINLSGAHFQDATCVGLKCIGGKAYGSRAIVKGSLQRRLAFCYSCVACYFDCNISSLELANASVPTAACVGISSFSFNTTSADHVLICCLSVSSIATLINFIAGIYLLGRKLLQFAAGEE